jgi:hypothetical protein
VRAAVGEERITVQRVAAARADEDTAGGVVGDEIAVLRDAAANEIVAAGDADAVTAIAHGDGRIVVTAAKKFSCKAVGFDIDPERVEASQQNVKKNRVEKLVTIQEKDIFKVDLRPASVVTLYLLPELNVKLIPQLEKLKPGSRILSHEFDMKGVKLNNELFDLST